MIVDGEFWEDVVFISSKNKISRKGQRYIMNMVVEKARQQEDEEIFKILDAFAASGNNGI